MKWLVDKVHSEIDFRVRHMMISNVKGTFKNIDLAVETNDETFENTKVEFVARAASIDTRNEQRDEHLRSADFLDADNFPTVTFKAENVNIKDGELKGELTIRGVSKEINLKVDFAGVNTDPWGNKKAGFSVQGKISRSDFGLNWNTALETGGVLVSDEIRIEAEVQLGVEA